MYIIRMAPNDSGAYASLQTWNKTLPPDGYAAVHEDVDTSAFYNCGGFIQPVFEQSEQMFDGELVCYHVMTSYEPDTDAWEEWKANNPEPEEPETPDGDTDVWKELDEAYQEGVDSV